MSGNLWMISDLLDDEDIEMLRHDFITYYQGADYYGMGLKIFTRMAHEAGAVYKVGRRVLVRREIFEEYLREIHHKEEGLDKESNQPLSRKKREGVLICDPQSGRMDIRFGVNEYFGGLNCGTAMDVLINNKWVHTRIEMGNGWYLIGVETTELVGLIVRI